MASSPTMDPPAADAVAVRAMGLCKDYGDRPALRSVDLAIAAGQRVVVVGHNGSGKTTLVRLAAGMIEPTSGEIRIGSARAGTLLARRAVSWLPDTPTFYDDLSLWEHLEYVARLHGVLEWGERAEDLVARLGLSARRDDLPSTFSRGLRQKASIAIGLVRPFEVLLVDEPFVGLDEAGRVALLGLFDEVHHRGATVIVATHEPGLLPLADRIVALRDGLVVHDGSPGSFDANAEGLPG